MGRAELGIFKEIMMMNLEEISLLIPVWF